jgi:hypothetical protein
MGRPLNKKYFGNRNIGTTGTGDNRIGGEGVASVTINTVGSYTTALPTATFSTPDIPGGVRTTGIVHGNALSASTTANGSGYNFGDTLTVVGGTRTSAATFTVAATLVVDAVKSAGGSGYNDGDLLTFSTGFSPSLILRVNRPGGGTGTPDDFTITQAGRRTSANPTNPVAYDSRTGTGNGCTVTLTFGVYSFSSVVVQGDYTAIPASPVSFTGGGTGAAATVPFGVSGVEVTEKGSGYSSVADAAIAFSGGAAAATPVLTIDTGGIRSATNQENAIVIRANTSNSGSTAKIGDIIKQNNTRSYTVKTADGIKVCKLGTDDTPAPGQAYIIATATGGTYYVTKLTSRRATLATKTGDAALDGESVKWTFGSPTATTVQIENA